MKEHIFITTFRYFCIKYRDGLQKFISSGHLVFKWYTLTHSPSTLAGCSPPVLSLFRGFIESQLFCLPEFHPLGIRNESHLRSISSPPSQRLQTEAAAHRPASDFSHVSNSPTPVDVGDHLWRLRPSGAGWVLGCQGSPPPGSGKS